MKTLLGFLSCFYCISPAMPQALHQNGAYSTNFTDVFSFVSNAASLAAGQQVGAGIYAENKFGLRELNSYTAAARTGGVGVVMKYAGDADFNRSQLGLAYGKNLGKINIGARFNYNITRMPGYGNESSISLELGSIWKITESFFTGMQISYPSIWSIGAGYECSKQLFIGTTITKEENKPVNVHASVLYTIADRLLAMLGVNSSTSSPSVSLGWIWKNMRVMMSGNFHPQLGLTKGFGIMFFGKKK